MKRAMMARAETNMLLVDHSKFGVLTLENVCPLPEIRLIVADRLPAGDLARAIKRLNLPIETGSPTSARRP